MVRTRRTTMEMVTLKTCKPDPDEEAMADKSLLNGVNGGIKKSAAAGSPKTTAPLRALKSGGGGGVINSYEEQRLARIAENKARLLEAGIHSDVANLRSSMRSAVSRSGLHLKKVKVEEGEEEEGVAARVDASSEQLRKSQRLVGRTRVNYDEVERKGERGQGRNKSTVKKEYEIHGFERLPVNALMRSSGRRRKVYGNLEDDEGVVKPIVVLPRHLREHRCDSEGRGSVYDSVVGLCCHFCRQKKLCAEPDCDRCGQMDATKRCRGKTECSRCQSSTGIFCRACILLRYGSSIEEVRSNPNWICAHCTEAEGSDPYWICNSSVCIKRHKLPPLGVAIYEARRHGYPSVAHLLKSKLETLAKGN